MCILRFSSPAGSFCLDRSWLHALGFLRQAAKPQHSAPLPVISSIWKSECGWECSQSQKMKCAFIWVSQLCSDPGLPRTQMMICPLPCSLLQCTCTPFSCCFCRGFRMNMTAWPPFCSCQTPSSGPLLEHLCYSPCTSSTLINNFDFVGSVPSWEAAGEVRWKSVWVWYQTKGLHVPNLKNYGM